MTRRSIFGLSAALSAAVSATLLVGTAPAFAGDLAGPDLAGRWNSASLRTDGVGYTLRLQDTAVPGRYEATARMVFQDGRRGPKVSGTLVVAGDDVRLRLPRGTVRGTIGQDGSVFFPRCARVLAHVEAGQADAMCLFQEFDR